MTLALPAGLPQARAAIDGPLRAAVARLAPSLQAVAAHHFGWRCVDGRPAAETGKALRPALALLAARAAGAPECAATRAAVAVELVHNFSLLHDDLMDGDRTRHHRPTAWAAFGPARAVLAGDALLALAAELALELPDGAALAVDRCLTEATAALIGGQAEDLAFEDRTDVTVAEYLAMAGRKTGALLVCALRAGALSGSAGMALAESLGAFGAHLGLAFQLTDDLLGIWGDPAVTGKPPMSDLRTRKKSGPVVAALRSRTPSGDRLAELLGRGPLTGDGDLRRAALLVERAGGREWAAAEADRRLHLALDRLSAAAVPVDVHEELTDIACFVTARRR
ncbi:polyprenyl synthetase family protein [Geodermatophilus sp. DF01-2]|uniref:polyprenyl synthetase family protein n=1 Tax=Geodermatophilus sp. DF01-2 TaxID=2559610 RepID=UPI001073A511|nr:polyprenyl synthetase family protein [Geodermatophilus sp. DF01_2]TFV63998.1 polyprenyl synthetase family protein [Geodermatophilus sp. DF01_2]